MQLNTITLRTCGPTDEALARAGREHLTTTVESFAALYATLLEVYRRRMRPPYTFTDLTLTLAALSEGFAVQAMTGDPPRPPPAASRRHCRRLVPPRLRRRSHRRPLHRTSGHPRPLTSFGRRRKGAMR